jgi:uncharacterized protein YbjT (DUF2867 family)
MTNDFLILGGTGKTGRRVASRLLAHGASVRSASRHPIDDGSGARAVAFDWADPSTHDAALDGADAVYVIPPAMVLDHVDASTVFFQRAASHGVQRLVFLSARGVDADDAIPMRRAELALFDTPGLDATVIRPSWFAQNFTEGVFAAGVADGLLAAPAGDGREPFIDADDIADVATALLLDRTGTHGGQAIDLSGSVSYTFAEAAALLAGVAGRPVQYVDLTPADFVSGAVAAGLPADYAGMMASLFEVIRNGWDAHVSDGVERVLGRPARSLEQWAVAVLAASPNA